MSEKIERWNATHDGHGAMSIETDGGRQVCFVRNEKHAQLIAAAPELLLALMPFANGNWTRELAEKARDAIFKATGA